MKIFLMHAEHFSNPGIVFRACATMDRARQESSDCVRIMMKDHCEDLEGVPANDVNSDNFETFMETLQDYHGAAHCYAEITELELLP